ncbi:MAG TPA: DUF5060 domain-containing protein [Candidatus Paceibacterota bacterium]|nr:DUF5060 domain-containing protein [Candidatus Paceibacterota bacterium]
MHLICLCLGFSILNAAGASSGKLQMIPKWSRFEQAFKSSVVYANPLQDCTLKVVFHSPLGETNIAYGFWDGGKTWRVRFLPDQPGRWSYETLCSDSLNDGLRNQAGTFLCTAPVGADRFAKHGPLRVSRDRRHFEHQDGTPFFWLADEVWEGARRSTPGDWNCYAQVRAAQKFTAAQFSVCPGKDFEGHVAFNDRTRIIPNLEFFQRLDSKITTLNRAGLLSVIAPLWNRDRQYFDPLPETQKLLLLRYVTARWGADNVAWLLHCEGNTSEEINRWKLLCKNLFAGTHSGPVLLALPERLPNFSELADAADISAFGFRSTISASAVKELLTAQADRPLIQISSVGENRYQDGSSRRTTDGDVRPETWSNLLGISTAGTCYSCEAVTTWSTAVDREVPDDLPLWQKSLFLPGVRQMSVVSGLFNSIPFWELRPAGSLTGLKVDFSCPVAQNENRTFGLFYNRQSTLELPFKALPPSPLLTWLDVRTGKTNSAVAVVGPRAFKFPVPDPGDWVLIVKTSGAEKPAP